MHQLEHVTPLMEVLHPGCELLFAFDNSQNHHALKSDALSANGPNLNGGKNMLPLRDTQYYSMVTNDVVQQGMQFENGAQKVI